MPKDPNNYLDEDCNLDLDAVGAEITFLFYSYCLCDEASLTKDAVKLRKQIKEFVDCMARLKYERQKFEFKNM